MGELRPPRVLCPEVLIRALRGGQWQGALVAPRWQCEGDALLIGGIVLDRQSQALEVEEAEAFTCKLPSLLGNDSIDKSRARHGRSDLICTDQTEVTIEKVACSRLIATASQGLGTQEDGLGRAYDTVVRREPSSEEEGGILPDDLQRSGRGSIDLQGAVEGIAAMTEVRRGKVVSLGELVGRISCRLRLSVDTIIIGHGHRAGKEGYSRCALRPSKRCRGDHRCGERRGDKCASHFLGLSPVASIEIEASEECASRSGIDEAWGRAVGRARRRVKSREGFLQQALNSLYRLSLCTTWEFLTLHTILEDDPSRMLGIIIGRSEELEELEVRERLESLCLACEVIELELLGRGEA